MYPRSFLYSKSVPGGSNTYANHCSLFPEITLGMKEPPRVTRWVVRPDDNDLPLKQRKEDTQVLYRGLFKPHSNPAVNDWVLKSDLCRTMALTEEKSSINRSMLIVNTNLITGWFISSLRSWGEGMTGLPTPLHRVYNGPITTTSAKFLPHAVAK